MHPAHSRQELVCWLSSLVCPSHQHRAAWGPPGGGSDGVVLHAAPAATWGMGGSGRWTILGVRIRSWCREEAGRQWPQQLPMGLPITPPPQPSQTPVSHLVGVIVGKKKESRGGRLLSALFLARGMQRRGNRSSRPRSASAHRIKQIR